MNLTDHQLLYTKEGREHLRVWCEKTVLQGDAKQWLVRLEDAERRQPVVRALEKKGAAHV